MKGKNTRCGEEWTAAEFEKFTAYNADKNAERVAFITMYWTGLRVGELLGLQVKNLMLDRRLICVRQSYCSRTGKFTKLKTENAKRNVIIPAFLIEELSSYLKENRITDLEWRVFNLSENELHESVKQYCQSVGIKRMPAHYFRNMHIHLLVSLGVPDEVICERLGISIALGTGYDSKKINADLKEILEKSHEEAMSCC